MIASQKQQIPLRLRVPECPEWVGTGLSRLLLIFNLATRYAVPNGGVRQIAAVQRIRSNLIRHAVETQNEVCLRFGVVAQRPDLGAKLGIALATIGKFPINGLRVSVDRTCGWFIWGGGEASADPDFYQPLHVAHIDQYLPSVEPYFSLPPGYRFQIADGHEDVWFDPTLLVEK